MDWLAGSAQNILDLPPEMLEEIFNFLPLSDFVSVINTCEWWHDIMDYKKAQRLFPKVLPIVIKRNRPFSLGTMLTIRQVNKNWHQEVNKLLSLDRQDFQPDKYTFENAEKMERFATHAVSLPPGGNPFLGNRITFITLEPEAYEPFLQVIRQHGHQLTSATIAVYIETLPQNEVRTVLLNHIPNVETLAIGGFVENWDLEVEADALPPPPLQHLRKLYLLHTIGEPEMNPEQVVVHQRVVVSLLTTYGEQLTIIMAPVHLLRIEGIGNLLPNLLMLMLEMRPEQPLTEQDLQVLSQVEWKLGGIVVSSNCIIEPSPEFFGVLNNFSNSLLYLKLRIRFEAGFDPTSLLVFPLLNFVNLGINSSLRSILEEQMIRLSHLARLCPNLEHLELEIQGTGALMDVELDLEIMKNIFKTLNAFSVIRLDPEQ